MFTDMFASLMKLCCRETRFEDYSLLMVSLLIVCLSAYPFLSVYFNLKAADNNKSVFSVALKSTIAVLVLGGFLCVELLTMPVHGEMDAYAFLYFLIFWAIALFVNFSLQVILAVICKKIEWVRLAGVKILIAIAVLALSWLISFIGWYFYKFGDVNPGNFNEIVNKAIEMEDPAVCYRADVMLGYNMSESCLVRAAKKTLDGKFCLASSDQEYCFTSVALYSVNKNFCNWLKDPDYYKRCVDLLKKFIIFHDRYCSSLGLSYDECFANKCGISLENSGPRSIKSCFEDYVIEYLDKDLCLYFDPTCFWHVAFYSGNEEVCNEIEDSEEDEKCVNMMRKFDKYCFSRGLLRSECLEECGLSVGEDILWTRYNINTCLAGFMP